MKDAGQIPPTGYTIKDPGLTKNDDGVFRLRKRSAAVDKAKGKYPQVVADMDGQQRQGAPDIGADELSNKKIRAKMLSPLEVGHLATATKD